VTERGMAKITGTSQPHMHNILKGIRALPPELADRLMSVAGLTLDDLVGARPPSAGVPPQHTPISFSAGTMERRSCYLPEDACMQPRFQAGDLVFFDQSERARMEIDSSSIYVVNFEGREWARYVRRGGNRLYLAAENSLGVPGEWDFVSLLERTVLDVVKGRIIWICRQVEAAKAPQQ
jgi:hypothetical protein